MAYEGSQTGYSTILLDETSNEDSNLTIEIINTNDELLFWAEELHELDEPGIGASAFEIELYEYLLEYRNQNLVQLAKVKAYKRTCSALDNTSARQGMASWYGPEFQGRLTANGERFDQNDLTAAHKTIPFNSIVEVTHQNRTIRVRINDAGPYHGNRIIDLSKEAARQLGLISKGTGKVRLTLILCGQK